MQNSLPVLNGRIYIRRRLKRRLNKRLVLSATNINMRRTVGN